MCEWGSQINIPSDVHEAARFTSRLKLWTSAARLPQKKARAPQEHGTKRAAAIKAGSKKKGSQFPSDFKPDWDVTN